MDKSDGLKSAGNRKLVIIIGVIVVLIAVALIAAKFITDYVDNKEKLEALNVDTIYSNVYVNNINIGGLTKEDALAKLEIDLQQPFKQNTVCIRVDDDTYEFTYDQLGIEYDLEKAVEEAYDYGRDQSMSVDERYDIYSDLRDNIGKFFVADFYESVNRDTIKEQLSVLSEKIYIAPKNATAKRENGAFSITEEVAGREFDLERAVDTVEEMINIGMADDTEIVAPTKEIIEAPTKEIQAEFTSESLSAMKDLIGEYSTKYTGSGNSGRVTNMRVAASRLNGTVLYPGQVFSTNACFGESTPANGYQLAGAYLNGKLVDDYGGGVCQVSSTLYNAVLRAELGIVERQNHSLTVGYVPRGFDATLAGDYIDFKFKNTTSVPLYIESYLSNNQVVINIFGKEEHSPGRTLKFENALISQEEPPAEKITYSDKLAEGAREVTVTPLTGYTYKTYKLVYENGQFVEKVELATSRYKARRAEVTVGKNKAMADAEEKKDESKNVSADAGAGSQSGTANTNTNTDNTNTSSNNAADAQPEQPDVNLEEPVVSEQQNQESDSQAVIETDAES